MPSVQQTSMPNASTFLTISRMLSKSWSSLTSLQAAPMQNLVEPACFASFAAVTTASTSINLCVSISDLCLADCGQ